jgi:hypothetical protein
VAADEARAGPEAGEKREMAIAAVLNLLECVDKGRLKCSPSHVCGQREVEVLTCSCEWTKGG